MIDFILASIYPVLLLRKEPVRLVYLFILTIYYNTSWYGLFLFFCCFVECSEIFLRKTKVFFSDDLQELCHYSYNVLFCVVFIISSVIWYGLPPFPFVCDSSRYISSTTNDFPFILCLSMYCYDIFYLFRPKWFAVKPLERNVTTVWLTFACILLSSIFGVWLKCLEVLLIIHFLEAIKNGAKISAFIGKEILGFRLMKIHQIISRIFIIPVIIGIVNVFATTEESFCVFVVLIIYAMSLIGFGIEQAHARDKGSYTKKDQ